MSLIAERIGRLGCLLEGTLKLSGPGLEILLESPVLTMPSNLRIDDEDDGGEDSLSTRERVTVSGEWERRFPMDSGTSGEVVAGEREGD